MKFVFAFLTYLLLLHCAAQQPTAKSTAVDSYITTASGLKYKVLQPGNGPHAKVGQEVLVRETTTYLNGAVLYTNEKASPVKVLIGGNQATNAVDEGLRGMQQGEIMQLIAPANLVKRKSYPPNVWPDSSLAIKIILDKIL